MQQPDLNAEVEVIETVGESPIKQEEFALRPARQSQIFDVTSMVENDGILRSDCSSLSSSRNTMMSTTQALPPDANQHFKNELMSQDINKFDIRSPDDVDSDFIENLLVA